MGGEKEWEERREEGKEGKGREEREGGEGKGAYRDEGPLTKILNTPLHIKLTVQWLLCIV